jgi:AraC-like DNA-binding protein
MRDEADPGIAGEVVGVVAKAITELGFDVARVPGISLDDRLVPGSRADALFEDASAYLLDDALGLSVAARIPLGSLGPLDYGLCTSETLREALDRVARHYSVVTQRARIELVEDGRACLVYHRLPGIAHSRHWIEFAFAAIATRIRQTAGVPTQPFLEVTFVHPSPPRRDAHDEFFGTKVVFDAELDRMAFDQALLDRPLLTASRSLAELLEKRLEQLAPMMAVVDPILDSVRRAATKLLDAGALELDALATELAMTKRTLQRTLTERQTSYTALVDDVRRGRATELLEAGYRVVDVAARLGFTDPSSFFRAYRRWTGTSPRGTR